jgi:hypothetical protein
MAMHVLAPFNTDTGLGVCVYEAWVADTCALEVHQWVGEVHTTYLIAPHSNDKESCIRVVATSCW